MPDTPIPVLGEVREGYIPNPMNAVHNGSADVLYADGYVEDARKGELTVGMFYR